jgi:toxin ParE1/3/4
VAHRVIFAPEAEAQLVALYRYIAESSSPAVAKRFTDAIVSYCEGFAAHPKRGTRRDDVHPGLRTVGFRRRVTIAFTVDDKDATILGVYYAGQDVEAAMRDAPDRK